MNLEYYDALHRSRAERFEHDVAVNATTRRLRRAQRLERTARIFAFVAGRLQRLARRLEARAGTSRARLL